MPNNLRELKTDLRELEDKFKKAMVANASLDNEKCQLMFQVSFSLFCSSPWQRGQSKIFASWITIFFLLNTLSFSLNICHVYIKIIDLEKYADFGFNKVFEIHQELPRTKIVPKILMEIIVCILEGDWTIFFILRIRFSKYFFIEAFTNYFYRHFVLIVSPLTDCPVV